MNPDPAAGGTGMAGAPALHGRLQAWRAAVDRALATIAADEGSGDDVSGALRYALATGGKRLRPILCLAAADTVRPAADADAALRVRAAAAIELVHTYSLVHDDLPSMDDDDLRRGRPTAHRVFGTVPAMLAGFALVPLAARILEEACAGLGLGPDDRVRAVAELCRAAGAAGMVGGQVLDLEAEGRRLDLDGLRRVHAMKTGALFGGAVGIGGILAGADAGTLDALSGFGQRLGLAFQITDDILDVTMDAAALGKTPGKDRDAHKVTFAALLGVEAARRQAAAEAAAAVRCLRDAGLRAPVLEALAGFAVERDR
jgi:geranylgeranyl diphosphate synthase, type II